MSIREKIADTIAYCEYHGKTEGCMEDVDKIIQLFIDEVPEKYIDGRRKGELGQITAYEYIRGYNRYRQELLNKLKK